MQKKMTAHYLTIGDVRFAIYPFGAMTAAGISGDLSKFIGPLVAGLLPLAGGGDGSLDAIMKSDITKLAPLVSSSLTTLDSDNVQKILMELLIDYGNVNCEYRDDRGELVQSRLTKELADDLFIGSLEDMVRLAIEVVKVNFGSFFTKLTTQSGLQSVLSTSSESTTTESSTETVSIL